MKIFVPSSFLHTLHAVYSISPTTLGDFIIFIALILQTKKLRCKEVNLLKVIPPVGGSGWDSEPYVLAPEPTYNR